MISLSARPGLGPCVGQMAPLPAEAALPSAAQKPGKNRRIDKNAPEAGRTYPPRLHTGTRSRQLNWKNLRVTSF